MSFRPRRLWSRHWRGITSSFCCIAACMHACMHACKHARHGMRAASGARAPRRKAAGGQLETRSRQGTRWSGIKRGSIPRRDLSRVKFYFPVENLPSALSGSKERKKVGEFSTVLIYRWQNLSSDTRRSCLTYHVRVVFTGARDGERSGIGAGEGGGGGGKEKFSYRLADKRRKTRRMEGVGARHLSGKGKRHDGISEIALDIFACISLSVQYHLSPFPGLRTFYFHP